MLGSTKQNGKKKSIPCFKISQENTCGNGWFSDVSECAVQQREIVIQPAKKKISQLGLGKMTSHTEQKGWSPGSPSFSCFGSFPCQPLPGPRWHTASPPMKIGCLQQYRSLPQLCRESGWRRGLHRWSESLRWLQQLPPGASGLPRNRDKWLQSHRRSSCARLSWRGMETGKHACSSWMLADWCTRTSKYWSHSPPQSHETNTSRRILHGEKWHSLSCW